MNPNICFSSIFSKSLKTWLFQILHLFACVIQVQNVANSYQMTTSLLVLNVGNVLISGQRALESQWRVYTREQLFACLQYKASKTCTCFQEKNLTLAKNVGNVLVTTKMLKDWPFIPEEKIYPTKLLGWTRNNGLQHRNVIKTGFLHEFRS